MDVVLMFDGLVEPRNPGGNGCWAFVLYWSKDVVEGRGSLGSPAWMTNNYAEFVALGKGLAAIAADRERLERAESLTILGDSKLVISQLNGDWQCKSPVLQTLRTRCVQLLEEEIRIPWVARWVPRELNTRADELGRQAYNSEPS
jgi:ribonuclease HI